MPAITRWAVLGLIAVASAGANAFADKSPLEGMSFDVAITHGGTPVGASRLKFEHGSAITATFEARQKGLVVTYRMSGAVSAH